jgi:hypothetical protein
MSVHQESLDMVRPAEREAEAPELEYNAQRHDSLTMFGAAIGGAILGMLLTLLVLAIINGGTLSFSGGERLAVMEATVARVDENVGALAYNLDVVAQQAKTVQAQLQTTETSLRQAVEENQADISSVQGTIDELQTTNEKIGTFLIALKDALSTATEAFGPATAGQ